MGEGDDTVGTGETVDTNDISRPDDSARVTAWVHGAVQGVGFRWWTRSRALELELVGSATNLPDGRVQVVAEGSRERCERLLEALRGGQPPGRVDHVAELWAEPKGGLSGFVER
ncbi:acylphosphatase [Prauserella sediminis]|uniref:acylphosphatase n=1 Tax=Prauserella sediminis TaxID=577680 RepID=A0A839XL30_9PSEU|nr:acylphosphatase [Prauserella sediminis]